VRSVGCRGPHLRSSGHEPSYHQDDGDEAGEGGKEGGQGAAAAAGQQRRRSGHQSATGSKSSRSHQPTFDFRSRAEKRLTFTLVFQTLKCKYVHTFLLAY